MASSIPSPTLELHNLNPDPGDEWQRMLDFVGLGRDDKFAMSRSVETLMRRAPELVVQTYDYLRSVPETAAILGWEDGVDETHLEERRRFFTIWIARTLGMDTSREFADDLFRAGKFHAGHGPRRIHVPSTYIAGSMGLVQAAFAGYMAEARLPADLIAAAMAGWNKYLVVQLHMMLSGYQVAREFDRGHIPVQIALYGRLRPLVGKRELQVHAETGSRVNDLLHKFFNYYPQARAEALDRVWHSEEKEDSLWVELMPVYVPRWGWRVLVNGRNVSYNGGPETPIHAHDTIAIFPPGR